MLLGAEDKNSCIFGPVVVLNEALVLCGLYNVVG